jgi:hypothetical protein
MGESVIEDAVPVLVVRVAEEDQVPRRGDARGKNPTPRLRVAVQTRDAIVPAMGGALKWNADRSVDALYQPGAVVGKALSRPADGPVAKEPSCQRDRLLASVRRRGPLSGDGRRRGRWVAHRCGGTTPRRKGYDQGEGKTSHRACSPWSARLGLRSNSQAPLAVVGSRRPA